MTRTGPRRRPELLGALAAAAVCAAACSAGENEPDQSAAQDGQIPAVPEDLALRYAPAIGPVKVGMTEVQLLALGLPHTKEEVTYKGSAHAVYRFTTEGGEVDALLDPAAGSATEVWTRSPSLATVNGGRPGDTLARLQQLHPQGHFSQGNIPGLFYVADGLFVTLNVDNALIYFFDADELGKACVVDGVGCPADMSQIKAEGFMLRMATAP